VKRVCLTLTCDFGKTMSLLANAPPPDFFRAIGGAPWKSAPPNKVRGRAGRRGLDAGKLAQPAHLSRTHGPRHLATSRRNGDLGRGRRPAVLGPQVRRTFGVPRAVFEACSARPPVG